MGRLTRALGFERSSNETSSLQIFGGRNREDLSVAVSFISQIANEDADAKCDCFLLKSRSCEKARHLS